LVGKLRKTEQNEENPVEIENSPRLVPSWVRSRPSGVNNSNETTKDTCRVRSRIRRRMRFSQYAAEDLAQTNPDENSEPKKKRHGTPINKGYTQALRKAGIMKSAQMDPEKFNSPYLMALVSPRNNKGNTFATCDFKGSLQNTKSSEPGFLQNVMKELDEKDEEIKKIQTEKEILVGKVQELSAKLQEKHSGVSRQGKYKGLFTCSQIASEKIDNRNAAEPLFARPPKPPCKSLKMNKDQVKRLVEQLKHLKIRKPIMPVEPSDILLSPRIYKRPNTTKASTSKKMTFTSEIMQNANENKCETEQKIMKRYESQPRSIKKEHIKTPEKKQKSDSVKEALEKLKIRIKEFVKRSGNNEKELMILRKQFKKMNLLFK